MKILQVDGATLEGGGQLIRLFIGLSALTGRPVEIFNIRGNRRGGGGLKQQHLTAIEWLGRASGATLTGASLKSKRIIFEPSTGKIPSELYKEVKLADGRTANEIAISMDSAGAVTLILQAVLPFLLFSPTVPDTDLVLTMKGGTNVSFSPSIDYALEVFSPNVTRLLGLDAPLVSLAPDRVLKRGWTHGGVEVGQVSLLIRKPARGQTVSAFDLSSPSRVDELCAVVMSDEALCNQLAESISRHLAGQFPDINGLTTKPEVTKSHKRNFAMAVAVAESGLRLGVDIVYDEKVGKGADAGSIAVQRLSEKVTSRLKEQVDRNASVDVYCEDQLVVFQALAKGRSIGCGRDRGATLHTRTARWAVTEMLKVEFDEHGSCNGIGMVVGGARRADLT